MYVCVCEYVCMYMLVCVGACPIHIRTYTPSAVQYHCTYMCTMHVRTFVHLIHVRTYVCTYALYPPFTIITATPPPPRLPPLLLLFSDNNWELLLKLHLEWRIEFLRETYNPLEGDRHYKWV